MAKFDEDPQNEQSSQYSSHQGSQHPWNEHDTGFADGGLRAAVFGASDGLVTSIGLVLGVFAAAEWGADGGAVFSAGIAGLLAGACSMAAGEWISMTAQAEAQTKELQVEEEHFKDYPIQERTEMIKILQMHGLTEETATLAVNDLEQKPDRNLEFHARFELGIDPDELGNPMKAMGFSFIAFGFGALPPILPWIWINKLPGFFATVVISIFLSFAIGLACSRFTATGLMKSGFRQLFVSIVTAGLTFTVGYLMVLGGLDLVAE